jgi:hypothetical protein
MADDPTILTGIAPDHPRKPPMADPRDIVCVGRKRFEMARGTTLDDMARPDALAPLAEEGSIRVGDVIDVIGPDPSGFKLTLEILAWNRWEHTVTTRVLAEDDLSI